MFGHANTSDPGLMIGYLIAGLRPILALAAAGFIDLAKVIIFTMLYGNM